MIDLSFEDVSEFKKGDYEVNQKVNYCWHKRNAIQKNFYISIFVTNNINMQKINFKYRKKNKTTNVLSFPQNENRRTGKSSSIVLGDIVVSLEKVYEESLKEEKHFYNHLSHMIIHSLLHLLGFDHDTKKKL